MISGHVAGVPVEETLLALAPLGAVGVAALYATRARLRGGRRRAQPVPEETPACADSDGTVRVPAPPSATAARAVTRW
jgi:hypothetical protein